MTILRAQVEANECGLCHCGQQATSELSYAEEMDQRQDASSPSPPSSPLTDGSYQTPTIESVTCLVPVPKDIQLPSPTTSEEVPIPVPPPCASTPGHEVSVMDMVIFRTIFFELFSFLHVHAPYSPFRLLTNLRNTPRQDKNALIRMADSDGTKGTSNTCYYYEDPIVESDSSITSSSTGARVGTITEGITLASSSTTSSRTGNSSR